MDHVSADPQIFKHPIGARGFSALSLYRCPMVFPSGIYVGPDGGVFTQVIVDNLGRSIALKALKSLVIWLYLLA